MPCAAVCACYTHMQGALLLSSVLSLLLLFLPYCYLAAAVNMHWSTCCTSLATEGSAVAAATVPAQLLLGCCCQQLHQPCYRCCRQLAAALRAVLLLLPLFLRSCCLAAAAQASLLPQLRPSPLQPL
jgi:hypothetical protein